MSREMTTGNAGARLVKGLEKTYNGNAPRGAGNTVEGLTTESLIRSE